MSQKPLNYLKISENKGEQMVQPGDYGTVKIIKGKYKGYVGLYDDDEGNKGIVYISKSVVYTGSYVNDLAGNNIKEACVRYDYMDPYNRV